MQTRSFRGSGEPAWAIASSNACEGLGSDPRRALGPSVPHQQAGHMTAPDQCCINVGKLLSTRRRPHMTQWGILPQDPHRQPLFWAGRISSNTSIRQDQDAICSADARIASSRSERSTSFAGTFVRELVEHVEHPVLASIVGAILDEVIGPDMVALLRPQPDARSGGQPEPAALGLLMGNLQPLALPDTLDPLVVDCPARLAQELGDLAIAIAAVLPSKLDNIGGETLLVSTTARDLALRRAMLPERRTGATLGDMQLRSDLLDAGTATRGV
jgi:hypothetical protein